jgi:hypothetical protein
MRADLEKHEKTQAELEKELGGASKFYGNRKLKEAELEETKKRIAELRKRIDAEEAKERGQEPPRQPPTSRTRGRGGPS